MINFNDTFFYELSLGDMGASEENGINWIASTVLFLIPNKIKLCLW